MTLAPEINICNTMLVYLHRSFLVFVITTIQLFSVLSARSYQLTDDAWTTELVADRKLWDVLPPSQPVRTLVPACPGVDAIRIWPLPVQQPWVEVERVDRKMRQEYFPVSRMIGGTREADW